MKSNMDEVGECESYDAIVVGSGYGGSVAACRLAMAGVRVCVMERGRRWEAQDFPVDSLGLMSAVRMERRRWGFGSKEALFQMYQQDDSFVCVACGLGGGSLINAGVMAPTPLRARRDPKWPKEWQRDWDICELSASTMLGSHSVPLDFPSTRVMRQITKEEIEEYMVDPIKLSINFGPKETPDSVGSQLMGNCLACGNCLSGCPYNAKNSTDKNYLASAIQAGCLVKTECKVLYIMKNPDKDFEGYDCNDQRQQRRWRVYFDNLEYVYTDFVVLSAGVLGTTEILLKSQRRGLNISERLGYGFSCNGNNVAYVAGSQAPLHAYGLTKKNISKFPFNDRPGPSISSSYISSLGFTIQSAVLPTSYPYLLFKGVSAYGWPIGFWFLHGLISKFKHLMGLKASQDVILNVMGYDECNGRITLDEEAENIHINPPHDPLLPKKVQAFQSLSKKLGGIMFMSRFRSTSVHLLGGCNAATNPSNGVCNPEGQVFNPNTRQGSMHEGLYVCDASLIPCSIGINPCLTIATVAEHVSRNLVNDISRFKIANRHNEDGFVNSKGQEDKHDTKHVDKVIDPNVSFKVNKRENTEMLRTTKKVTIKETMRGFIGGMPCTAYLVMEMNFGDNKDCNQRNSTIGEPHPLLKGKVGGFVVFQAVSKDKLHIMDGKVDMCRVDNRTPYTQYVYYRLFLASASGSRYILVGRKVMNPYLLATYAWRESRTLHVTFKTLTQHGRREHRESKYLDEAVVDLQGELHVSMFELLKSLLSLKGKQRVKFICLLLQSIWRTYILQVPRQSEVDLCQSHMIQTLYPESVHHELETEDGCRISCQEWRHIKNTRKPEEGRQQYPVLLLNGYSLESYWLPTEPKDLVRTLLEEGHETWLLQSRSHPLHPSNNFTIEDIGRFDIPAVIEKIVKLKGPNTKIHVIAHCVGGLAIHIALLGGHVSATHIASVSCTNSSMYFKLIASSLVKMRLPLIPVSMAILGKNKILSMHDNQKETLHHRLLKSIARIIPRYERCTTDECEVFSGIFGNVFWHENVTNSLHQWLNKKSLYCIPMAAFPHIKKICTSGFIVDSEGRNKYLIHPERMPLATLYISGGRSLFVTPETSLLGNKYMRLHQPGFRHRRVVVEGFGHSDLLIGEKSYERVFPHFISHMRLAEEEIRAERTEGMDGVIMSWDGSHDGNARYGTWCPIFSWLMLLFILLLYFSLG